MGYTHPDQGLPPDSWVVNQAVSDWFDPLPPHRHDSYEFYLHICNGRACQIGDQVMSLQPYQLLVIPPHQVHGLSGSEPRKHYERMHVQVHPQLLSQMSYGSTSLKDIVDQHCGANQQVFLSPLEYLHLKHLAASIPTVEEAATPLDKLEAMGYLCVMVGRFCRALMQGSTPVQTATADALMQEVHNHIQANFAQDCSLKRLSEQFNVSKYHLSRRFSETYGISLHQFLLRCRVAQAQALIRQGETMMSVFEQCGFNDYSSFVRAFDSIAGMSPRAWRQQEYAQAPLPCLSRKQEQMDI